MMASCGFGAYEGPGLHLKVIDPSGPSVRSGKPPASRQSLIAWFQSMPPPPPVSSSHNHRKGWGRESQQRGPGREGECPARWLFTCRGG